MSIRVEGFEQIELKIDKFSNKLTNVNKTLEPEVIRLRNGIFDRTEKGFDVDGKTFRSYSSNYKRYKEIRGRNGNIVDLIGVSTKKNRAGRLKRSIKFRPIRSGYEVYVAGGDVQKYGLIHQLGIGKMPKRKFFGFDKEQIRLFSRNMKTKRRIN